MQCALAGDTGGVDAALQRGESVNEVEDGRTALHQAAAEGQLDVVKLLLYWHADTNRKSRREEDNGNILHTLYRLKKLLPFLYNYSTNIPELQLQNIIAFTPIPALFMYN